MVLAFSSRRSCRGERQLVMSRDSLIPKTHQHPPGPSRLSKTRMRSNVFSCANASTAMAPAGPAPMTATLLTDDKDGMFSTTTTVKVVQMPPTKSRTRLDHNISVFQPRRSLRTPSAKGLVSDHRSGPGPRNRDAAVSKTPVNVDCAISRHHLGRILPQSSPRFGFHDENVRKSEPHLGISGVAMAPCCGNVPSGSDKVENGGMASCWGQGDGGILYPGRHRRVSTRNTCSWLVAPLDGVSTGGAVSSFTAKGVSTTAWLRFNHPAASTTPRPSPTRAMASCPRRSKRGNGMLQRRRGLVESKFSSCPRPRCLRDLD